VCLTRVLCTSGTFNSDFLRKLWDQFDEDDSDSIDLKELEKLVGAMVAGKRGVLWLCFAWPVCSFVFVLRAAVLKESKAVSADAAAKMTAAVPQLAKDTLASLDSDGNGEWSSYLL
jgi:hypothetical protein